MAIIGPTNAGKSTLLNRIMGRKVSIVSHKVQTTRTRLRAVKMVGDAQLIFVDTPGVFKPKRTLDRAMVAAAMDAVSDADAVLLLVDATHGVTGTIRQILERFKSREFRVESIDDSADNNLNSKISTLNSQPLFISINKVDAIKKETLLPMIAELSEIANPREIFMISALKNDGLDKMLTALAAVMPESPYLYDPTDAPDVPDELYLAELTREKIYKYIHQELPYHIHVETERVDVDPDGVLDIYQKIVVNSDAHKKIVVGRGGLQLKQIGTDARHDIQDQWGVNARLHLFVRVEKDWEERRENYETQGLEYKK